MMIKNNLQGFSDEFIAGFDQGFEEGYALCKKHFKIIIDKAFKKIGEKENDDTK